LRVFLFGRIVFASDPADARTILTDAERFQAWRYLTAALGATGWHELGLDEHG